MTIGNIYADRVCHEMSIEEFKKKVRENDDAVMKGITVFSQQLIGCGGFWRYERKKLVAHSRFLEIISNGHDRMNVFLTFSMPDSHIHELHSLLPGSEKYLGKIVVKTSEEIPIDEDRNNYILESEDFALRREAINNNGHIVDEFATRRLENFVEIVLKNALGITEYAIRVEFQSRTAIHYHMIGRMDTDLSMEEMEAAVKKYFFVEDQAEEGTELEKKIKKAKRAGEVIVPPGQKADTEKYVRECQEKVIDFAVLDFGLSAIHPQNDVYQWPEMSAPKPKENVVRHSFPGNQENRTKDYEMLVNRVQRHKCTPSYCQRVASNGDHYCRFCFPQPLAGYRMTESAEGKEQLEKRNDEYKSGGEFHHNSLVLMRNHQWIVTHVPEILQIWRGG